MPTLPILLAKNRDWAKHAKETDPQFFERLSKAQHPEYLWIGCSDSRVPANQILNLLPGEVFVHRNIANIVKVDDENCMSVLQYAVDVLKVKHIMVTGHYGCGGVAAAMKETVPDGVLGNWLSSIKKIYLKNQSELSPLSNSEAVDRMCEMNVLEQTHRLSQTNTLREAWARGQEIEIHSWIYSLSDGLVSPLRDVIREPEED